MDMADITVDLAGADFADSAGLPCLSSKWQPEKTNNPVAVVGVPDVCSRLFA